MDFREFTAKTVDEAIIKASIEFETSSENLEIQVIEQGSSGFLGFGVKSAKVKVRIKEAAEDLQGELFKKTESAAVMKEESMIRPDVKGEVKKELKREVNPDIMAASKTNPKEVVIRSDEEVSSLKDEAERFLNGVFGAMELSVVITMNYSQEESNLDIEFSGDDMGILIGKRGQTLDSLQYLVSLVVNKGRQGYIRVKLDTENYRNRRKETLENLAKSIAYKVRKTRKPVSLEPMNPYERRIIHSALQGNKYVETTSEGNEPYRHVVVKLKK